MVVTILGVWMQQEIDGSMEQFPPEASWNCVTFSLFGLSDGHNALKFGEHTSTSTPYEIESLVSFMGWYSPFYGDSVIFDFQR